MTTTMKLNKEKNGVELYFDGKPSQSIIDTLKENKFRWSNFGKFWYCKQTEKSIKFATDLCENNVEVSEVHIKTTKKESIFSLWEATRIENIQTVESNKMQTKEIAKEIRTHIKNRFPMIKFSVTTDHRSIRLDIMSSPFAEDSEYLKAVCKYCTEFAESYKYCTCYDPYGDYGSSYNFYDGRCTISWEYEQIEADVTEICQEFDSKKFEFEKIEAERRIREFEESERQREEQRKAFDTQQAEEKKISEQIENQVKATELKEEQIYFVKNCQFANLNKNNALDQYIEEVESGRCYNQDVKITKDLHFDNAELFEEFSNMLLNDFTFLTGTGGSYTDDERFTSMTDFYSMTEEERKTIKWNLYGVAVYLNNELKFVIDAQGHNYARYIGLVENAEIIKNLEIIKHFNDETLEDLKLKAETIEDLSTEIITNNGILKTWKDEDFNLYKNNMKEKIYSLSFDLTVDIIRQIDGDFEDLKTAMYKILKEIEGTQEAFKKAVIQQGDNVTMFYIHSFGGITDIPCTIESITNTEYAQYKDSVKIVYKPQGKRKLSYIYNYKDIIVVDGFVKLPTEVLNTVENRNGMIITSSKYHSCDKQQYKAIKEYLQENNIKILVDTTGVK